MNFERCRAMWIFYRNSFFFDDFTLSKTTICFNGWFIYHLAGVGGVVGNKVLESNLQTESNGKFCCCMCYVCKFDKV